ncbi:unnamed protein product [Rhizophagus irregularis]|nr:unnamed protein product [Rhizophagus irregularis]
MIINKGLTKVKFLSEPKYTITFSIEKIFSLRGVGIILAVPNFMSFMSREEGRIAAKTNEFRHDGRLPYIIVHHASYFSLSM